MAVKKSMSSLNTVTSDFTHVYYISKPIHSNSTTASLTTDASATLGDCNSPDFEFPVVADSVEYNVGEGHEEIKLITGDVWAMKRSVDSSVQFNVPANNIELVKLFSGDSSAAEIESVQTPTISDSISVAGFNTADMKSITGALILTDDAGHAEILPNVKLTVSRGKDSLVYWTVKAVVMANKAGFDVYVTTTL